MLLVVVANLAYGELRFVVKELRAFVVAMNFANAVFLL